MRRLALFVVGLLVLSACTATAGTTTTTGVRAETTTTATTPETTTATAAPAVTEPRIDLIAEVLALAEITEQLRGLEFIEEPNVTTLTADELAARVRQEVEEELDPVDLARDQEALRVLGVLSNDIDLGEFYTDLLAEQVAGFYDSETKEMVVNGSADSFTAYDKMIVVHELTHALTDQRFDFGSISEELSDAEEFDALAALTSLIEGDATYVEGLYVQSLSQAELLELLEAFDELESPVFDAAPYYLQQTLLASYIEGLDFVTTQFGAGGWSGVDLAYRILPTTTEQILHADAYARGEPALDVDLPGDIPEGYEVGEESTWGESGLRALLGVVLLPDPLTAAVEGWGGDAYRVLWNGEDAVFQLHYLGDEPSDADELAAAFEEYLTALAPEDAPWWVLRNGDEIAVVISSDPEVGAALVADLDGFR